MPPRTSGIRKPGSRRKIALACEPCREKKVRCDGKKPICGPCERRSYTIERCVFKAENARSASNDEYLGVLHKRIRDLEELCSKGGIVVPPAASQDPIEVERSTGAPSFGIPAEDTRLESSEPEEPVLDSAPTPGIAQPEPEDAASSILPNLEQTNNIPAGPRELIRPREEIYRAVPSISHTSGLQDCRTTQTYNDSVYTSSPLDPRSNVTAMGAISVADDTEGASPRQQYYGSSSVASFMRLAKDSMPVRSYMQSITRHESLSETAQASNPHDTSAMLRGLYKPSPRFQFDDFSLPPRPLADHLLDCYWERVHCLYPFFHRPSFEQAYENLWGSSKQPQHKLCELNIGLGGIFDTKPNSIIMHCALNAMFALGCHFSDIPPTEREAASYSFFLRSKNFVGLDLLEYGTIGVVQTLLVLALLLQSTPYPARCWNAIGLACRVAQGLGLHEETTGQESIKPLEREVRRRTWNGCVLMDMIVSMTYGRPSMISHLSPVPPPTSVSSCQSNDPCTVSGQECDHKLDRPSNNAFMSWDEMGYGPDEFGFLGRFDMPDITSWFSDMPG
ncbi:hypothetical protein MW887_003227 [Aspergillus wentii]|nr:hypothetical protein MW887_003227 [Aspergillus wentii]